MLIFKIKRRISLLLIRSVQRVRVVWYSFLSTNRFDGKPTRYQPMQVAGRGKVAFEANVRIGVFPSPGFLNSYAYLEARNETASITVGGGTWINNGFCCVAEHTAVVIGRNCLIGANVEVLDSDFHGLKVQDRGMSKPEWASPVHVGDNVFLGSNVRILKGVSIGSGAVVANSSVVVNDIPANVIAAGAPARVIRELAS